MPGPQGYSMTDWNVAGGRLAPLAPKTGFHADGFCRTSPSDPSNHTIATTLTQPFLDFTSTSSSSSDMSKAKAGMKWCLAAHQWRAAMQAAEKGELAKEAVPRVYLHASGREALEEVEYKELKRWGAEMEANTSSPRQGGEQSSEDSGSIVKESQEIGGRGPSSSPGEGKNQSKGGNPAETSGNRG